MVHGARVELRGAGEASEEWEAKIKHVVPKLTVLNAVSDPPLANGADDHPNGNLRHVFAAPPPKPP